MTSASRRALLGLVALTASALTAIAVPAAATAQPLGYAALGDSMASGPLIPDFTGPLACGRSTRNYPHVLAATLGAALSDATCSGAQTKHLAQPQSLSLLGVPAGSAPPQFDVLRPDTGLVTITMGGNDVGLVGIAQDCVRWDPTAAPCNGEFQERLTQRLAELGPRLDTALTTITERSPAARVVVVGYGLYIRPGGCWPVQPVLALDADFLQDGVDRMNAVLADRAAAHGAEYVDLVAPSAGHDTCAPNAERWIEGYVPVTLAAPLHPNRRGEENYARVIAEHLSSSAEER